MLVAEATFTLKLKNGNEDGVFMDSSLLEDIIAGIGVGGMNIDRPDVETSDDNDNNDVHCHHPAGPSFWVQILELKISMPLSLDPLNMSTVQRKFVSHYYSVGRGVVALLSAVADVCTAKATLERSRQRRTTTGSRHQAAARDRGCTTKMSSRRPSMRRTTTTMMTGIGQCQGCLSSSSS